MPISVEKESMTIRVVCGRESTEFGRHSNAIRWAKLGVVIWVRFESFSSSVGAFGDDTSLGGTD